MKIVGYLRVSTEYQDVDNQKLGILDLANRQKRHTRPLPLALWKVDLRFSGDFGQRGAEVPKLFESLLRTSAG